MKYDEQDKQLLDMLNRTNFQHLSHNDLLIIKSRLSKLKPDVAKEIIEQFPQLATLLSSLSTDYKEEMKAVSASNDHSMNRVYDIFATEQDTAANSRRQYYDLVNDIRLDCSKQLEQPGLTPEENQAVLNTEVEILRMAGEKDSEIRAEEESIRKDTAQKDYENKAFYAEVLKMSGAIAGIVGIIALTALGGNVKIPKIKMRTS